MADENSFRQAIYTAIDVFRNRASWDEGRKDPLPKLFVDKRDKSERGYAMKEQRTMEGLAARRIALKVIRKVTEALLFLRM